MKKLDPNEREILDAYRAGTLEHVALTREEIERYRNAARAVARRDKRAKSTLGLDLAAR